MLVLAGLGIPAQASEADPAANATTFGISLLDVPASHKTDPRAISWIVDHLHPGTVIKRRVLLINNLPDHKQIQVYPGAASIKDGKFGVGPGQATNELTSWISVDHDNVDMRPGAKTPVWVTITVPNAASTGERYGVIWASLSAHDNASQQAGGIDAINRVGIRIYLHIGPNGDPPSDFTMGTLTPTRDEHGKPALAVEISNTGQRAVDVKGEATLSDGPHDTHAGPFTFTTTTLAPGESGTVTTSLPETIPDGPWKISVALRSGTVNHVATTTTTFAKPGQADTPAVLSSSGHAWPTIGAGVAALAALACLVLTRRRLWRKNTAA